MDQTILTFQVPVQVKQALKKKAAAEGYFNLSAYLRSLIVENIDSTTIETNPWLDLADSISKVLTKKEIEDMRRKIYSSRKSRSEKYWKELAKNL
jgi:hypothetical protein